MIAAVVARIEHWNQKIQRNDFQSDGVMNDRRSRPSANEKFTMRRTSKQATFPILLPTDFQEPARRAFAYAVKLANVLGARLHILHVIKALSPSPGVSFHSRYLNPLKTSAMLELGRLSRLAKEAGIHTEPHLLFGEPSDSILGSTARFHAGLVVMGTHGRTGWDRLRLGSTTEAVVRKARCPVLTLQEVVARDSVRRHATAKLDRFLVATDFSSCADAALRYVSRLAPGLKAKVCVLHAAGEGTRERALRQKLNAAIERLQRAGIEAESLAIPGDPVEIILKQAAEWQADMIAVGSQGRRGLSRLLLGSVAEALLRRSGCPVLIVKNRSR
ncbi:MAG: putative Universal stress protein [Nitrospira sp.]|jgi:nucleotide-binding universal stress UspA family protein|nr:putative Universal stress protein [Nitrospira sp.]